MGKKNMNFFPVVKMYFFMYLFLASNYLYILKKKLCKFSATILTTTYLV